MSSDEFKDIAPYQDEMFRPKVAELIKEPGFRHAVQYIMPDVDFEAFTDKLLSIKTSEDFQKIMMYPILELLEKKTTAGITVGGLFNLDETESYTFITNHRDIVLDASFLNLTFLRAGRPTTEIAIGDNLLIYDWIDNLVRLNKSFIVRRNLKLTEALQAARHLSAYIQFCINSKKASVWIAQREGRAKDSNDVTQESLIKMFGLSGEGQMRENIESVNLLPVSISYEFDPNDYLKVREFLLKRRDPNFRKSQHDDLFSMETGLLSYKGRIHYEFGRCISPALRSLPAEMEKGEFIHTACSLIDSAIHRGYRIYPINYIAYDIVHGSHRYEEMYTEEDVAKVKEYAERQLARIEEPDITAEECGFMYHTFMTMYANPLINKLKQEQTVKV